MAFKKGKLLGEKFLTYFSYSGYNLVVVGRRNVKNPPQKFFCGGFLFCLGYLFYICANYESETI